MGGRERIQFDMEVRGMRRSTYSGSDRRRERRTGSVSERDGERLQSTPLRGGSENDREREREKERKRNREDHPRPIGNLFPPLEVEPRPIGGFGSAILSLRVRRPGFQAPRSFSLSRRALLSTPLTSLALSHSFSYSIVVKLPPVRMAPPLLRTLPWKNQLFHLVPN